MNEFDQTNKSFHVDPDYADMLNTLGMADMDGVFNFSGGKDLAKSGLAKFRKRIMFSDNSGQTFFLKRYQSIPKSKQIKNWLEHKSRKSTMSFDMGPVDQLAKNGIATPQTIAFGQEFKGLFEKRSFIITKKIPKADSLEKKLPDYFTSTADVDSGKRKKFIESLADFARRFHQTGFRHRDFYLCHIFCSDSEDLTLIDLNRIFRPSLTSERFRVKDIAQLYYSAPGSIFSKADRLRFYIAYAGIGKLSAADRRFIKKVKKRAKKMAAHDIKHSRQVPFAS